MALAGTDPSTTPTATPTGAHTVTQTYTLDKYGNPVQTNVVKLAPNTPLPTALVPTPTPDHPALTAPQPTSSPAPGNPQLLAPSGGMPAMDLSPLGGFTDPEFEMGLIDLITDWRRNDAGFDYQIGSAGFDIAGLQNQIGGVQGEVAAAQQDAANRKALEEEQLRIDQRTIMESAQKSNTIFSGRPGVLKDDARKMADLIISGIMNQAAQAAAQGRTRIAGLQSQIGSRQHDISWLRTQDQWNTDDFPILFNKLIAAAIARRSASQPTGSGAPGEEAGGDGAAGGADAAGAVTQAGSIYTPQGPSRAYPGLPYAQ